MLLNIRLRHLTRNDLKGCVPCWINNGDSLPPWSSAEVSHLSTEPASHSLTVRTVSLQNTVGLQSSCTSHTILQPFFLRGNYLFVPLLPLLGQVDLVEMLYWHSFANHKVCSGKHICTCSFKMLCQIFAHISEASSEGKYINLHWRKFIFLIYKINWKEAVRNDFIIILEAETI